MDNREAERQPEENVSKKSWRIRIGTWMFYVPFGMFFGAPVIIPLLGFSATESAAAIGAIIVAAEVIWFASIPLLGKKGFNGSDMVAIIKFGMDVLLLTCLSINGNITGALDVEFHLIVLLLFEFCFGL